VPSLVTGNGWHTAVIESLVDGPQHQLLCSQTPDAFGQLGVLDDRGLANALLGCPLGRESVRRER
jgi:hypothetical protein